jgi:hypothetical protein
LSARRSREWETLVPRIQAGDPRAVEELYETVQFSERFEREAKAIAALNHPNNCHLYDVGLK